jgi:alkylation response protein AidB-like acyl-CoA dehydrogenase
MSEPEAGSDLSSVRTSAQRVEGGWLVTGTKVWTSNAHLNDYFAVLCRTSSAGDDRHAGLSQLIVDLHAPGVTVRGIAFLDGTVHFNEVQLDEVFVADDLVLGDLGSGWTQVTSELAYERSGPDRYLSTFPVIREFVRVVAAEPDLDPAAAEAVGRIAARLSGVRQLSLSVARALDAGSAPAIEAALVKDLGTAFEQLSIEVMRLASPLPIDPDGPQLYQRLLAEAVLNGPSFTLRGGTTEILRSVAAKGLSR